MNKELIKKRFGLKLNSYNENAKIQKQMAERLLSFLPYKNFKSVLELGCGTGLLTELAASKFSYEKYTALDIVPECSNYINKINSNIDFISHDAEEYIKKTDKTYDLIISNASFQWIENLPDFVSSLLKKINPNGILLFSTFGTENYREIFYVLGKTLPYLSKKYLEEEFSKYKIIIEEEIRVLAFKTPKDVLKHIQSTGVNAISEETWTKKNLISFEKEYNSFCANHPTLTYNPIYVLIKN